MTSISSKVELLPDREKVLQFGDDYQTNAAFWGDQAEATLAVNLLSSISGKSVGTASQIGNSVVRLKKEFTIDQSDVNKFLDTDPGHGLEILQYQETQGVQVGAYKTVYAFECIRALVWVYKKFDELWKKNYSENRTLSRTFSPYYEACVRSTNALALVCGIPESERPIHPELEKFSTINRNTSEFTAIRQTWDISVCLLGAMKFRSLQRGIVLPDCNILHTQHYRDSVNLAIRKNMQPPSQMFICNRTISSLCGEAVAPFVRPYELIRWLAYDRAPKLSDSTPLFNHASCTADVCRRDNENMSKAQEYHRVNCPYKAGGGAAIAPPSSIDLFNKILANGDMPAVNIDKSSARQPWWRKVDGDTMTISHVWRDGIFGERESGLCSCNHKFFSLLAKSEGCKSFWIDSATIPKSNQEQRSEMIKLINKTFNDAKYSVCYDRRLSTTLYPEDKPDREDAEYYTWLLLMLLVSFWHRRAWTVLEGNKSRNLAILRETNTDLELVRLTDAFDSIAESSIPLAKLSAISELLVYNSNRRRISPEKAGLILSSRTASRRDDSELIWAMLARPFAMRDPKSIPSDDPFFTAEREEQVNKRKGSTGRRKIDSSFISSDAQRTNNATGLCWIPSSTTVSKWSRAALGGTHSYLRRSSPELEGLWLVKLGTKELFDMIDWNTSINSNTILNAARSRISEDNSVFVPGDYDFMLVCPIFDSERKQKKFTIRTKNPILLTRSKNPIADGIGWHWEGMVNLRNTSKVLAYTHKNKSHIRIGCVEGCEARRPENVFNLAAILHKGVCTAYYQDVRNNDDRFYEATVSRHAINSSDSEPGKFEPKLVYFKDLKDEAKPRSRSPIAAVYAGGRKHLFYVNRNNVLCDAVTDDEGTWMEGVLRYRNFTVDIISSLACASTRRNPPYTHIHVFYQTQDKIRQVVLEFEKGTAAKVSSLSNPLETSTLSGTGMAAIPFSDSPSSRATVRLFFQNKDHSVMEVDTYANPNCVWESPSKITEPQEFKDNSDAVVAKKRTPLAAFRYCDVTGKDYDSEFRLFFVTTDSMIRDYSLRIKYERPKDRKWTLGEFSQPGDAATGSNCLAAVNESPKAVALEIFVLCQSRFDALYTVFGCFKHPTKKGWKGETIRYIRSTTPDVDS